MVLGSTADRKGRLLFYKSSDLVNWEYVNFTEKDGMGWMWECPDYFETDGTGVIVISPLGLLKDEKPYDAVTICALADFDEASCKMDIADKWQLFDCGEDLYAPQSTADENGRRVIIAWARMPEPFAKTAEECSVSLALLKCGTVTYISVPTPMPKGFSPKDNLSLRSRCGRI